MSWGRRGRGWTAGGAVTAHVGLQCVEFLLLFVGQQCLDAVIGAHRDGARLGAAVILRERFVLHECLHLLLTIDQQGFDLALLIRGEVQFAGQALELAVGVHAHVAALGWRSLTLIWGWWGRVVLSEGGAGDAEGEQAA